VIQVVGGGAAGCEVAWALARRGVACRLVTTTLDALYALPAEVWPEPPPAVTLWAAVAEEARAADGVGTRASALRRAVKRELERLPTLSVLQSNVVALWREGGAVVGVRTWEGPAHRADATVLAVGTFLGPRLRVGAAEERAGRLGEMAYDDLRTDLAAHGVQFERQTLTAPGDGATPPHTVDFDRIDPTGTVAGVDGATSGPGIRRWPDVPGVWLVGACADPVGVVAAAAAGRDLGAHLAGHQADPFDVR
jgi:tRNA U34 5-carboxymethylaminomethyl modifying enzyme MnmG/GidA